MSAVSQLIKVKYTDMTNYSDEVGGDVLGVPFEHHWGPVGQMETMSRTKFFQNYPESLPMGTLVCDTSRYFAYAQIKKAFELGLPAVEAYRVQGGWKYHEYVFSSQATARDVASPSVFESGQTMIISTKYPGIPPRSLTDETDAIVAKVTVTDGGWTVNIKLYGSTKKDSQPSSGTYVDVNVSTTHKWFLIDESELLEEWEGSLNPSAVVDGRVAFIEEVAKKSQIISVRVNPSLTAADVAHTESVNFVLASADYLVSGTWPTAVTESDYITALGVYEETLNSDSTLIISPVNTNGCDATIMEIASSRQDVNAVVGYPTASTFTKAAISTFLAGLTKRDMFSFFVAGREQYKVFGINTTLNCVGGWVGATCNIASTVRTNQLASAFSYGKYVGTISESLGFDEVCELHKMGVMSVFSSYQGNLIWGTRSLHKNQMSYFGKANVMRVLAKILRQVFPVCLNAIHTDAAVNPITRSSYNTQFNGIISQEIAEQNIMSDSYAECTGDINSDYNTKGGTIFNVLLVIHFIGLVESIKIAVYATDSSVTAEIV